MNMDAKVQESPKRKGKILSSFSHQSKTFPFPQFPVIFTLCLDSFRNGRVRCEAMLILMRLLLERRFLGPCVSAWKFMFSLSKVERLHYWRRSKVYYNIHFLIRASTFPNLLISLYFCRLGFCPSAYSGSWCTLISLSNFTLPACLSES